MKALGDVVAVARLTLIEAWRRKVWVVLLLYAVVLIASAGLFGIPGLDLERRLRLVVVWSIRATTIFSLVLAVFVAALALPGDFEHRRIYVLATKPVSKLAIYLGRFAGFAAALGAFVLGAALLSVVYLAAVEALSWGETSGLEARPHRWAQRLDGEGPEGTIQWTTDDDPPRMAALHKLGQAPAKLVWRFRGLAGADLESEFPVVLHVDVGYGDFIGFGTTARVRVVNPETGRSWEPPGPLEVHAGLQRRLAVPLWAIGRGDALVVEASPAQPGYYLIARERDAWVLEAQRPFWLNLVKTYALAFLAGLILLSVTLAASAWLSAPVSMFVGTFVFLAGMMAGGIAESLETTAQAIREARQSGERSVEFEGHTGELDLPLPVLQYSHSVSKAVLKLIPHFARVDPREYLLGGKDVSIADLGRAGAWSLPYWLVPLAIGLLLIRFREFR